MARRERGDNAFGEEVAGAPESGEEVGAARDAFLLREIDAAFVEARGDFGEIERGTGGRVYEAGQWGLLKAPPLQRRGRSEEHTSELQSLMRISYAVFCLKKNKKDKTHIISQDKTV